MTNAMNSEKCDSHAMSRAAIKAVADFLHQEDDEYSDDSFLYRASVFLRARLKEGSE
jgi:hypothetical protein